MNSRPILGVWCALALLVGSVPAAAQRHGRADSAQNHAKGIRDPELAIRLPTLTKHVRRQAVFTNDLKKLWDCDRRRRLQPAPSSISTPASASERNLFPRPPWF